MIHNECVFFYEPLIDTDNDFSFTRPDMHMEVLKAVIAKNTLKQLILKINL